MGRQEPLSSLNPNVVIQMVHARKTILDFEALEDRSMFAVAYLGNGLLNVTGTKGNDTIHVSLQGSDFCVVDNGVTSVFALIGSQ